MGRARFPDCRRSAAHGMERSLPCFTAPAVVGQPVASRPAGNRSNHHRYGEVKTRLTIDGTGQFARYYHIILEYYFWRLAMATTVTRKGQVTIPKPVRDHLGIGPGSQIAFRRADNGSIVIEKAAATQQPSRFAKVIGSAGPGLSTDEIMALLRGNDP